jgi:hypothetical protein
MFPGVVVEWVSSGCRYAGASLSEQMCICGGGFVGGIYLRTAKSTNFFSHVFHTIILNICVLQSTAITKNHVFCKEDFR